MTVDNSVYEINGLRVRGLSCEIRELVLVALEVAYMVVVAIAKLVDVGRTKSWSNSRLLGWQKWSLYRCSPTGFFFFDRLSRSSFRRTTNRLNCRWTNWLKWGLIGWIYQDLIDWQKSCWRCWLVTQSAIRLSRCFLVGCFDGWYVGYFEGQLNGWRVGWPIGCTFACLEEHTVFWILGFEVGCLLGRLIGCFVGLLYGWKGGALLGSSLAECLASELVGHRIAHLVDLMEYKQVAPMAA